MSATVQTVYGDGAMPDDNAYTRTFCRAIETLGGADKLAKRLGASIAEIEAWAAGHSVPPPGAFLTAIDIVAQPGTLSPPPAKT